MMHAAERPSETSWLSKLALAIYRFLPLPVYYGLLAAYWFLPFLRSRLGPRLGEVLPSTGESGTVWFHASSVGEVSTIGPVVEEVRRRWSDCRIVVSTMTPGGKRRASEILGSVEVFLLPVDVFPVMRKLVSRLRASALVIGETEIWPNLVLEARKQGTRIVLLNGRISKRSYPRYRLIRPVIRTVLRCFDYLLMRTQQDADRIVSLGADTGSVEVVGNTKYDILPGPLPEARRERTRNDLGIPEQRKVVTLGSAREGECEIVFRAIQAVRLEPRPLLIVAPRHMGLVQQVEQLADDFSLARRTRSGAESPGRVPEAVPDVIIIAEMGRLLDMYAISDVAIVGGTFRPFGGHNPLESASQGVVTVVGPHIQNIEDDIGYLGSRRCAFIAEADGLGELLQGLLLDDEGRRQMGRRASTAVDDKKGIAAKCVEILAQRQILP
jgi:3-deoxy-D-manno-octulosonic-acid transferase